MKGKKMSNKTSAKMNNIYDILYEQYVQMVGQ